MLESKLVISRDGNVISEDHKESWKEGYFISLDELARLVRDFQVDCHDGFVSNDKSYIENWLIKNKI